MKKIIIAIAVVLFAGSLQPQQSQAQVNVSINIGSQPDWGPSGYDYAQFYYLPDIDIYYDVVNSLYYYLSSGRWISAKYLPNKYRKYDLYSMYKVVMNERNPWLNNRTHRTHYAQYKKNKTQVPIRDNHDKKYAPSHNNKRDWVNPQDVKNQQYRQKQQEKRQKQESKKQQNKNNHNSRR